MGMFTTTLLHYLGNSSQEADVQSPQVTRENIRPISEDDLNRIHAGQSDIKMSMSSKEDQFADQDITETDIYKFVVEHNMVPVKILTVFANPRGAFENGEDTPASINLMNAMLMKDEKGNSKQDHFQFLTGPIVTAFKSALNHEQLQEDLKKKDKKQTPPKTNKHQKKADKEKQKLVKELEDARAQAEKVRIAQEAADKADKANKKQPVDKPKEKVEVVTKIVPADKPTEQPQQVVKTVVVNKEDDKKDDKKDDKELSDDEKKELAEKADDK